MSLFYYQLVASNSKLPRGLMCSEAVVPWACVKHVLFGFDSLSKQYIIGVSYALPHIRRKKPSLYYYRRYEDIGTQIPEVFAGVWEPYSRSGLTDDVYVRPLIDN